MFKQAKFAKWYLLLALVVGIVALVSAQTAVAQDRAATGIVSTGALNVRSGPGLEFGIITTTYQGHAVAVLGRSGFNTWVEIRTFDGVVGWVNSNYLQMDVALNNLPVVGTGVVPPGATPNPPANTPAIGVVNTGAVNVRSGPGYGFPIVTIAYQGYTFSLLGRTADNAWVNVRMVDTTIGWVNSSALNTNVPVGSLPVITAVAPPTSGATAVVNTGALNVRSGPGPQFTALTSVPFGTNLSLIGRNSNASWAKVRLSTGVEGWVNTSYIVSNVAITSLPIVDGSSNVPAGTVNTGALNVRSGPGVSFSVLEVVYQGTRVNLLGRTADSSWAQIQTPKGTTGWVNATLLQTNVPITNLPVVGGTTPPPPVTTNAVVTTGALNVRSGPGLAFPAVATVYNGNGLLLIGRSATAVTPPWVQVRLENGLVGWVNANFIFTNVPLANLPVTG